MGLLELGRLFCCCCCRCCCCLPPEFSSWRSPFCFHRQRARLVSSSYCLFLHHHHGDHRRYVIVTLFSWEVEIFVCVFVFVCRFCFVTWNLLENDFSHGISESLHTHIPKILSLPHKIFGDVVEKRRWRI